MSTRTSLPGPVEQSEPPGSGRDLLRDLAWVVGYFVVAGIVAGLVWWQVVTPPYFIRTASGGVMDQAELGRRIQADGWFLTIGAVAGLVGGIVLIRWRAHLPLVTVLVGSALSLLGGGIALALGKVLGRSDVNQLLKSAKVGAHVVDKLDVISPLVLLAWPIGFLIGAVAVLWGTKAQQPRVQDQDAHSGTP
jgi:hypothetical protein